MKKVCADHAGFTLVELAIALMVIGLLIGGVLKGQELIENARMTSMVRMFKDYETAVAMFRTTYNAWPGDMRNAGNILPDCTAAPCNTPSNATAGDERIGGSVEIQNFFVHLAKAKFVTNEYVDDPEMGVSKPLIRTPFPLLVMFRYVTMPLPTTALDANSWDIQSNGLSLTAMRVAYLDNKIDDGHPFTGDLRGRLYSPSINDCHDTDGVYHAGDSEAICMLMYRMNY